MSEITEIHGRQILDSRGNPYLDAIDATVPMIESSELHSGMEGTDYVVIYLHTMETQYTYTDGSKGRGSWCELGDVVFRSTNEAELTHLYPNATRLHPNFQVKLSKRAEKGG